MHGGCLGRYHTEDHGLLINETTREGKPNVKTSAVAPESLSRSRLPNAKHTALPPMAHVCLGATTDS